MFFCISEYCIIISFTGTKLRKKFKKNGLSAYHSNYCVQIFIPIQNIAAQSEKYKFNFFLQLTLDTVRRMDASRMRNMREVIRIVGGMVTTNIVLLGAIILHQEGVLWRILNSLHVDGDHPDGNPSKELHPIGIYKYPTAYT